MLFGCEINKYFWIAHYARAKKFYARAKNPMRMRKIIEERRKFLGLVIIALKDIFFSRGEKRRATDVSRSFHERATIVPHL